MKKLLSEIRECTLCDTYLPLGPRPVLQADHQAKVLVAGQAPGRKVHETGIPFDDPSGNRLREWMGVSKDTFYDEKKIAILPMGFCYPGTGKSGDLPPRPECAETWRKRVLSKLKHIQLTLVIGKYALAYHLPEEKGILTSVVKSWCDKNTNIIPLPHPSPRNNIWLKRNPWFEEKTIPILQRRIATIINA